MAKKDKQEEKRNNKNGRNKNDNGKNGKSNKDEKLKNSLLSNWTKRWIKATLLFLIAIIVVLSFPYFDKAGYAGEIFIKICEFLIGKAYYTIPVFLFVSGLIFLKTKKKGKDLAMGLAILVSIFGISGILAVRDLTVKGGGWVGFLCGWVLVHFFGIIVANIVFAVVLLIGLFIFLQFIPWDEKKEKEKEEKPTFAINKQEEEEPKIKGISQEKPAKPAPAKMTLFKKGDDGPEKAEIKKPAPANKNATTGFVK